MIQMQAIGIRMQVMLKILICFWITNIMKCLRMLVNKLLLDLAKKIYHKQFYL